MISTDELRRRLFAPESRAASQEASLQIKERHRIPGSEVLLDGDAFESPVARLASRSVSVLQKASLASKERDHVFERQSFEQDVAPSSRERRPETRCRFCDVGATLSFAETLHAPERVSGHGSDAPRACMRAPGLECRILELRVTPRTKKRRRRAHRPFLREKVASVSREHGCSSSWSADQAGRARDAAR
jgi:hypothetical protein